MVDFRRTTGGGGGGGGVLQVILLLVLLTCVKGQSPPVLGTAPPDDDFDPTITGFLPGTNGSIGNPNNPLPSRVPPLRSCNLKRCLATTGGCGGFERCLLKANLEGCDSYTIYVAAMEAYQDCLYGAQGYCSLEPVARCYDKYLLSYTRTPMPASTRTRPSKLVNFVDSVMYLNQPILHPNWPYPSQNRLCSNPQALYNATRCMVEELSMVEQQCIGVMPVARAAFFRLLPPIWNNVVNIYRIYDTHVRTCQKTSQRTFFLIPTFGPQSGGTSITILGQYQIALAQMGSSQRYLPCVERLTPGTRSRYMLVCQTSSGQGKVEVRVGDDNYISVGTFTYRRKPEITNVNNLQTILSGGTQVLVKGLGFTSAANPMMIITASYEQDSWIFSSVCTVDSDTEMSCAVPPLINPRNGVPVSFPSSGNGDPTFGGSYPSGVQSKRKRRAVYGRKHLAPLGHVLKSLLMSEHETTHHTRHKREVCGASAKTGSEKPINDNDLTYDVTFSFGGEPVDGGTGHELDVYIDPKIENLEGFPECYIVKSWFQEPRLELKGKDMGYPLSCQHYNITMGLGGCHVDQLYSDRLICTPPSERPESEEGKPEVPVRVIIASEQAISVYVGCVEYEEGILDNLAIRYGLIAGLAALVLILILVAVLCCTLCRRRSQKPKANN